MRLEDVYYHAEDCGAAGLIRLDQMEQGFDKKDIVG